ncbi:MAG: glucose-6-phosphate dehydrogenase assembly protein OpcA [Propionibacteriaceae bacterium]
MRSELPNTNADVVAASLLHAQQRSGGTSGLVFTLIIACDRTDEEQALKLAAAAGLAHPSRIIVVSTQTAGRKPHLDTEIRTQDGLPGEVIVLRLWGELREHADSVILPLLLPDLQVVVFWPGTAPETPADDVVGALASRRVTDAAACAKPINALLTRAKNPWPGTTDLSWTRITPWRALLAAALDQYPSKILGAEVAAAKNNAPAELLAAWLEARLGVKTVRTITDGPGITAARLLTPAGPIEIARTDGVLASYAVPGQPKRTVALRRREQDQLIAEELARMDVDDIFDQTLAVLLTRSKRK